jgi:tetratricopeptide (TPR) repeat protein
MSFRFPQPSNEDDFELFCLRFLRELWQCPTLQQYGKRGERQDGIDLIDEGGNIPLRAVQCKHHEPDKTIPPAEIKVEVTKALVSGFDLGEYFVLTSARKTTHSQKAIIEINQDHAKQGKFRVSLWTWAEIEAHLSAMDDAVKDRVLYGDTGRTVPVLVKALTGVLTAHFDSPLYSSESALDGEIDAAKAAVDAHKVEVATDALDRIESRHGGKLSDGQWYRVKAMRATLLMSRGEWEKAGTTLLDAKRHQPGTERARVNEALAYELLGDRTKAHQLATALRTEFPHSVRPVAVWLRTAPEDAGYADLEAAVAPLPFDEEIHLALSHRGLVASLPDKAAEHATVVIRQDDDSPHGHFQLGLARHQQGRKAVGHNRTLRLGEAEKEYDRAIDICRRRNLTDLEAGTLVNRGILRGLLGDPRAEADLAAAADRSSKPEFRLQYGGFLLDRDRFADALRELLRAGDAVEPEVRFLEAAARHGRNEGDDRTVARQLLTGVIGAGPGERWLDAHLLVAQFAVEERSVALAEAVIRPSALASHNPLAYHAILGWLAHERADAATADHEVIEASRAVQPDSEVKLIRLLAQVQATRGNNEAALPLLERCARPGVFDGDGRRLLACAIRLGRHDVVQRICRELRLAGETDQRLIRTEIQVLQLYDAAAAFRVAEEYLVSHPDDKHVTLWRSHLAIRLERPELVVTDLARLPAVSDVDPREGQLVIITLRAKGEFVAALDYSYQLIREYFEEEEAHGQYLGYFHLLSPRVPQLRSSGIAEVGSAICYRETEDGPEHWVVIEPGADPDPGRNEYPPDHHLAKAFLGKSAKDTVVLSAGAVQDRTATVLVVLNRYVYRFQATMREFQVRFPDSSACQMVRVMTGGLFDPAPFIKGLHDRRKHIEQLDDLYRAHPIPLCTYASWGGSDELAAWEHLGASSRLGIRCCSGQREEFREAIELLRTRKTVVLDATALHTLARLRLLSILGSPGWAFVVSQATYDYYRDLAERGQADDRERGTMMLREDGGLTIIERSPEYHEDYAAFLRSIPEAARAHCQIRPCPAAAALPPTKRSQLDEILGRRNLEAMILAGEAGAALWTDDHVVGLVARSDFHASRVWTQVMLTEFMQQHVLSQTSFEQASARLVGWHYNATQMSAATLVAAAEIAEWDCTRWPVHEVMEPLGNAEVSAVNRLSTAAYAIKAVWQREDARDARQGFLLAVLSGVRSVRLVQHLLTHIPHLFGLDFFSGDEVADYIRYWLRNPPVIVVQ